MSEESNLPLTRETVLAGIKKLRAKVSLPAGAKAYFDRIISVANQQETKPMQRIEIAKSRVTQNRVVRQLWKWRVRKSKDNLTADSANDYFDTPSKAKRAFVQHTIALIKACGLWEQTWKATDIESNFEFVVINDHRTTKSEANYSKTKFTKNQLQGDY